MRSLSIIVVALNEAPHLARLAASVQRLREPSALPIETILADGGSSDGTADAARQANFSVVLDLPGANIPRCRNQAAAAASGDWIAFVDADCELAPDWLNVAAPFIEKGEPVVLGWPAAPPQPPTWVQDAWYAHWMHKNVAWEAEGGLRVIRRGGFRLVTTRNMLVHRSVYDRVGGFDEALETGEDTDFVFRAYQAGIPVLALPALQVTHHGDPATLRDFFQQQIWHANRGSYRKIAERKGLKAGGRAPIFTVAFLAALVLFVLSPTAAFLLRNPALLLLALPLLTLLIAPAAVIAGRAGRAALVLPLVVLYAAYGAARTLDFLGFAPAKPSWKAGR